ncbi:high-affinity nicotinic acid transporter [Phlyctema vagabunda]|uniref:High-affinity nicotinic acid transporter n=1 Tax=Phlyctema vagabunda TaxID=108571 RepID=A0ABR4P4E1_9HELO
MLRDGSKDVDEKFNLREAMSAFKGWKMGMYAIISFTYAMGYTTTSTFLPQIVQRLGFSVVKTNLWTVAPNCVGVVVLLLVTKSSDHFRERTFHLVFAMSLTLVGLIILATIDVVENKGVGYFAMFLMTSGAYIPSCLVHTWHNSNSLGENQRAAVTGLFVGFGNLSGIVSSATFRTEYAPRYLPTLIATATSLGICVTCTLILGLWMKADNRRRNREQGVNIGPGDVDTEGLTNGDKSPQWRWSS